MIEQKSHADLARALAQVSSVVPEGPKCQTIYGGLCHQFPVMIIQAGLLATVVFHESKAKIDGDDRQRAHALLLRHIAEAVTITVPPGEKLSGRLGQRSLDESMRDVRQLLACWVFVRRFAVSVLGVESGHDDDQVAARAAEEV